jgi:uncharacterized membrane protein
MVRIAFILSFIANIGLSLLSLAILPSHVAIHFGVGGNPDNWAPNYVQVILFLLVECLLFLMIYYSPRLVTKLSPRWVNLPNKDFWLSEENKDRTATKLASYLYQFGIVMFAFMFVVGMLTMQANLRDPARLNEPVFLGALGLYLVYTVVWCVSLYRGFRVPDSAAPGA